VFDHVDQPKRLGVCLDTAHFFAAGYDIRTKKGLERRRFKEVDELIGLKQVLGVSSQ
jgi:deoxyribonuclease-4